MTVLLLGSRSGSDQLKKGPYSIIDDEEDGDDEDYEGRSSGHMYV